MPFLLQFGIEKLWENLPKMQGNQPFFVLAILLLIGLFVIAYKALVPGTERQASLDKRTESITKVLSDQLIKEQHEKEEAETRLHETEEKLRQCEQKRIGFEITQNNPILLRALADKIEAQDREVPAVAGIAEILVVDDYADARNLLAAHLAHLGYSVKKAESSVRALDMCAKKRAKREAFDLILLDEEMSNQSGREMLALLRSDGDLTPVVFVTAYAEDREKQKLPTLLYGHSAEELGAVAIWPKPVTELAVKIKQVLETL